jgi:hypothetical protein
LSFFCNVISTHYNNPISESSIMVFGGLDK